MNKLKKFFGRYYKANSISILSFHHVNFIAEQFKRVLDSLGFECNILKSYTSKFDNNVLHIVLCPQCYKNLPKRYIAFNLEQTTSDRWLTDEYIAAIKNAEYIFDYSLKNIDYWLKSGINVNKLFYIPLWPKLPDNFDPSFQQNSDYQYDLLFYGDNRKGRRKSILEELRKHFNIKELCGIYGSELDEFISRSKIILNIHYYDDSILETTRICEALSKGKLVISETASDQNEHKDLDGICVFASENDIESLVEVIKRTLDNLNEIYDSCFSNLKSTESSFDYYFSVFLLKANLITYSTFKTEFRQNKIYNELRLWQ